MVEQKHEYRPDWVSPPGDTMLDLLEERDWTQTELAERLGYSTKHLSHLINGKTTLNEETALRLEQVLGSTANFWLNREAKYREHLARLTWEQRCEDWVSWLDELPSLTELKAAGILPQERTTKAGKPKYVAYLLKFFGVASPEQWRQHYGSKQALFRRTREVSADARAITTWLRLGEIEAEKATAPAFNEAQFKRALGEIKCLTKENPAIFGPKMYALCLEAGVTLVLIPAIPKAHVSGVARWLNRHRPMIQLSLYGKTNDKFWFTFFHEAAHLLLHASHKTLIYLDNTETQQRDISEEEREANRWAADFLISPAYQNQLAQLRSKQAVIEFASKLGIHPGIVVGRLQHENIIRPDWMNGLKASFRLSD